MQLVWPSSAHLPAYVEALDRGWSPDTGRPAAGPEERASIADDAAAFLAQQVDRDPVGRSVTLPDGSSVPRLPGLRCWMWDDTFCGLINLRWQAGTTALPPHCLGHIGYSVVPWQQRRGHATSALRQLLPLARAEGLTHVILTTDPNNRASQRVIEANGGVLEARFVKPAMYGGAAGLRYRIDLG